MYQISTDNQKGSHLEFDGQNAHTKIPPEISKFDLLHAHNIHFQTYSNNKDSLVLP
jgi:hypothetical protein